MKLKETIVKLCAAFLFGISAISLGAWGMNSAVTHHELQKNQLACFPTQTLSAPSEMFLQSAPHRPASNLMARLFQIMFILFIISPPLVVLMLFLIWQELKKRNELK